MISQRPKRSNIDPIGLRTLLRWRLHMTVFPLWSFPRLIPKTSHFINHEALTLLLIIGTSNELINPLASVFSIPFLLCDESRES